MTLLESPSFIIAPQPLTKYSPHHRGAYVYMAHLHISSFSTKFDVNTFKQLCLSLPKYDHKVLSQDISHYSWYETSTIEFVHSYTMHCQCPDLSKHTYI